MGAAVGGLGLSATPGEFRKTVPMVQCTSLKSNMGHLEPSAAAVGLASLMVVPLDMATVVANAQLHRKFIADRP